MNNEVPVPVRKAMRASWAESRARCENPNHRQYKFYGGRGIVYCERWKVFDNFLQDMGERPDGYTLERLDVDKGYSPDNCVWADRKQQTRNRRVTKWLTVDGVTRTLAEWAEVTGVNYDTLKMRVKAGYDPKDVVSKPVKCGARLEGKQYKERVYRRPAYIPGKSGPCLFSLEQVREIRAEFARGGQSYSSMARKLGVATNTVSELIRGVTYREQVCSNLLS